MRLNDSEWAIMSTVWEHGPSTARQVHERVEPGTGWATTTVRTLLARLVEKGALAEQRRDGVAVFEPLVTREGARASALRSLVERAFDGTFGSFLQHMLQKERLSRGDRARLRRMLDELDGPAGAAAAPKREDARTRSRGGAGSSGASGGSAGSGGRR